MEAKKKIWIISRALLLFFAAAFYYFTTSQKWVLALVSLACAFIMWFLPKLFVNKDDSGLCRSVEEDNRLIKQRKEQQKKRRT